MRAAITNTLVKRLRPKAEPYEVGDTRLKGFLIRVQPSGFKGYYVVWGRGKRKSLGRADVLPAERARSKAKEILGRHYMGEDPREEEQTAKRAMTFAKFIEVHYTPWAETELRTAQETVQRLQRSFPDLLPKQLRAITKWDTDKWKNQAAKRGLKAATVRRTLNSLQGALSLAVEHNLIPSNPLSSSGKKKKSNKKGEEQKGRIERLLKDQELHRLLRALDKREEELRLARDRGNAWRRERGYELLPDLRPLVFADYLKPMVIVSLHTGLRRGELFSLTWENINLDLALVTVHATTSKTGSIRHIPLNVIALETLRGWRKQSTGKGLVFVSETGSRFDNVRKAWATVLRHAKIDRFRWHDMRHHFASSLVMRGIDLATVRELMGHSDFALTLRYAHLAPEHRAAAVAVLVG